MKLFINLSNHPSEMWSDFQLKAAYEYGEIIDMPFPNVSPECDEETLEEIVNEYYYRILKMSPAVIMIQGEFSFCFQLVSRLLSVGIKCFTACSARESTEIVLSDGSVTKQARYKFVGFREYRK